MTSSAQTLAEFLDHAGHRGTPVGLATTGDSSEVAATAPDGFVVRVIDGAGLRGLPELYRAFARSWGFPSAFGANRDAFDEVMRDLDELVPNTDRASARGYLTVITDAGHLLADSDDAFDWFAGAIPFYRDHYRDVSRHPATFAVLLRAPASSRRTVTRRWRAAGTPVASVSL